MDEEQANAVEQAFDLDYDVAQAFCSHIVPKVALLFTGDNRNNGTEFEPEYGEGDNNNEDKDGDNEGGGGTGFTYPASAKATGEWWQPLKKGWEVSLMSYVVAVLMIA